MEAKQSQIDTGIANLDSEEIPLENIPLPEPLKTRLKDDIKEGDHSAGYAPSAAQRSTACPKTFSNPNGNMLGLADLIMFYCVCVQALYLPAPNRSTWRRRPSLHKRPYTTTG